MRILSARARDIRHDRHTGRIAATIILHIDNDGWEEVVSIPTSAPVAAPGGAPLKARLIASAKLILSMSGQRLPEAAEVRPAA